MTDAEVRRTSEAEQLPYFLFLILSYGTNYKA
jgi:hypothetical protein